MRWIVWWKQTAQSKVEGILVKGGTVLDAIAIQNKHGDAYESGRYTVSDEQSSSRETPSQEASEMAKLVTDMNARERQRYIKQAHQVRENVDKLINALEADDDAELLVAAAIYGLTCSGDWLKELFEVMKSATSADVPDSPAGLADGNSRVTERTEGTE
jgi:hypothetical protein